MFRRCVLIAAMMFFAQAVTAAEGRHFHFAIFFPEQAGSLPSYPDAIPMFDIGAALGARGARLVLFGHSTVLRGKEVQYLSEERLRETPRGFLHDGGQCAIFVQESGKRTRFSGWCNVYKEDIRRRFSFDREFIENASSIWWKIFEDRRAGVAGYVMVDYGKDFIHGRP